MTYCFRCTSCSALHGLEILNIFGSFLFTSLCTYIRETMWPWEKGKLLSKWWHSRPLDVRVGLYYIDQKVESEHNLIFQRGPRRNMKRTCPVVRLGLVCTSLDILVSTQMLTGVEGNIDTVSSWGMKYCPTQIYKSYETCCNCLYTSKVIFFFLLMKFFVFWPCVLANRFWLMYSWFTGTYSNISFSFKAEGRLWDLFLAIKQLINLAKEFLMIKLLFPVCWWFCCIHTCPRAVL